MASIELANAIKSYYGTFRDYFSPLIRKARKRLKDEYFVYDMASDGSLRFWRDILGDKFYNFSKTPIEDEFRIPRMGDIIELNECSVSGWLPFFPGKICSQDAERILKAHKEMFPENHDFGLEEELALRNDTDVLMGFANIRLLPCNHQYLLNASGTFGCAGIPILLSERLYQEKIEEQLAKEGVLSAKIVGTLTDLPSDLQNRMDRMSLKRLGSIKSGTPRIVLKVDEIKKIGQGGETAVHAWTQFIEKKHKFSALMSSIFYANQLDDIQKAVNMVANYKQFLEGELIGGDWEFGIEFDEKRNWFNEQYTRYENIDPTQLFLMYYTSPFGRPMKKP